MKSLIYVSILLLFVAATDVAVKDQCDCAKLLSQADCKVNSACSWSTTTSLCSKKDTGTSSTQGYCQLITEAAACAKTKGCAYVDSTCSIFAGCSAYKGATDAECQAISKFCNSDGTAYCIAPGTCPTYKTQDDCTGKGSTAGTGTCVWDTNANTCREQKCSDADATLTTDAQCNNFLKGCVTTGKGCSTSPLGSCSTYTGDTETCVGLKGSDGYCEGVDGKTNCKAKECTNAETTLTTDTACGAYQIGCVSTGYGCVKSPLGNCSTLTGDDVVCANKKGSDGKCKGVASGKSCSVVACTDAPTSNNTDALCDAYKSGCVTTGQGCIASRGACSTYQGTTDTCSLYVGSDGYCKGASDATAACSAKVCTGADASLKTNEACAAYQTGCVTTGKGCVATLSTCSSYQGDSTSCDGYIGTDGKCKGGNTVGNCAPKVCSEAPTTLTTNEDCSDYQKGCIASGSGGCVLAGACSTLLSQSQCDGVSTCQTASQCVQNLSCSDLSTEILCKTASLQNGNTCWWVSNSCTARLCSHAANTYKSDSACDSFLKGCWTNGAGCVDNTVACTSYQGTTAQCEAFTKGCTGTGATVAACVDRVCTGNTTATSDSACGTYRYGCVTTSPIAPGCVAGTNLCSSYAGTSTDICSKFKGNYVTPCWWTTGSTCIDKACTQAPNTVIKDEDCAAFLTGCVTTGAGCIANTTLCAGFSGNQTQCAAFHETVSSVTKFCSRRETCTAQKLCSEISSPSSQVSCDTVLPGACAFVKDRCMDIQAACTSYVSSASATLSVTDCQNLVTQTKQLCYWTAGTACALRTCAMNTTAADLAACNTFLPGCAKKPATNGCETVTCANVTSASTLTEANCQAYHSTCHLKYDGSAWVCFAVVNCAVAAWTPVASCSSAVTTNGDLCKANTGTTCQASVCGDITVAATCNATKVTYTSDVTYTQSTAQLCFHNGSACVQRSCANAATHLGGASNLTSRSVCSNYLESCALTFPTVSTTAACIEDTTGAASGCTLIKGIPDQCNKLLQGRYVIDAANKIYEWRNCASDSLNASTIAFCQDRTCANASTAGGINGITDAICQSWLSTCKTNGTTCVDIGTACTTITATSSACTNFTGITAGSKCQQAASASGPCLSRQCSDNGSATTDADCEKFLTGCITTGVGCIPKTTPCSQQFGTTATCALLTGNGKKCYSTSATKAACVDRICTHNTTATSNTDCEAFKSDCVTNGAGCVDKTSACSSYAGTQATCETFIGNGITCSNTSTATATTACINKDCSGLSTATGETDCQGYGKHCHYNGSGCSTIQTCAALSGNIVTCASYVASDGPCKGTALLTAAPSSCSAAACTDAPVTLTTDAQCADWKSGCLTTGYGCMSAAACGDLLTQSSCAAHVNGSSAKMCAWASQCRDVPSACSSFTASGQSVCLNANVSTGLGVCVWKSSACTDATCQDLPNSITSDDGCTEYSKTCTFAGAGCVVKGACTTYNTQQVCSNAKSTDSIGTCTWDTTVTSGKAIVGCRAKNCTDAAVTIVTDTDCNAFIAGCVTNGAGCVSPPTTCSQFQTQAACIKDSSLQPCLWYNNACVQYYSCSSLSQPSVSACQLATKYCTTDGSKCTPLVPCASYTKQIQCVTGTDGVCGWVTATKKCQLYAACADISSKVNTECSTYNSNCISNGTDCIAIGECSSYGDSQVACKLGGTDGTCFYDTTATACRLRQCSDATTSITTHAGCFGYQINASTKCTTSGSACISLAGCSTYTVQASCVLNDTLKACTWDATAKACKDKTCSDTKKTKSSECTAALAGCISDGTTCIAKATCATYTTQVSCQSGGTDGACAFTPASTGSTTGTCKLFAQCSDGSNDQTACNSKSAACKWTAASGTAASSCAAQTCDSAAKGTNKCVTVPSFDGTKYTVCQVQGTKCVTGDPSALTQDNCYKMSQYTYSWSATSKKCVACGSGGTATTNDTNSTTNNTANTTTPTTTQGQYLTLVSIFMAILF